MTRPKFNQNFLKVAQSPTGIGLKKALDLLLKRGLPDMVVRAEVLLAKEKRRDGTSVAAEESVLTSRPPQPLTADEIKRRKAVLKAA